MDCLHHPGNLISLICKAPHQCSGQRKLCVECQYEHGVDIKHTIPIKIFRNMFINKIEQYNLEKMSNIKQQRLSLKVTISKCQELLMKIFEELIESITKAFDYIEQENKKFINLINRNTDLAQSSYTELEQLIIILDGNALEVCRAEENSSLLKLQYKEGWLEREVNVFSEKLRKEMLDTVESIKITTIQQEQQCQDSHSLYQQKNQVKSGQQNQIEQQQIQDKQALQKNQNFQILDGFNYSFIKNPLFIQQQEMDNNLNLFQKNRNY